MQPIHLSDDLYQAAKQRALEAGYDSVEQYISSVISSEINPDSDNFDFLFSASRLASLDKIAGTLTADGDTVSETELKNHFENRRNHWHRRQA